jgi:putative endonuclease
MTRTRQSLGRRGEQLAEAKLSASGYAVVARNYRCRSGEIDLIARQGETLVFVEVRTRRGEAFGLPEASLTPRKRQHLIAAAQSYLQAKDLTDTNWRIDVVAVELSPQGDLLRVELIENAIQGDAWVGAHGRAPRQT